MDSIVARKISAIEPLDELAVYETRQSGQLLDENSYSLIDLFGGAGGMTLGFTSSFGHNFQPIWANDFNEPSVETYKENFGNHCVFGDIEEILRDSNTFIPKADVVIGGPPCQGFSLLNKKRLADRRRALWRPYLDVVERSDASVFVMENVPQLLGSIEYSEIVKEAQKLGFVVASGKLLAADYGVPQTRQRAFVIGCKFADPNIVFPPKRTHRKPDSDFQRPLLAQEAECIMDPEPWCSVRDAIGDLKPPIGTRIRAEEQPPYDLHFGRSPTKLSMARYRAVPEEGMNRFDLEKAAPDITPQCWIRKRSGSTDLFGRLWWDRPAFTIRTEFFKPEKGRYLHPTQHRPITHREAARCQSFPDSFRFKGSKIEIAKQIGNAVPPLLASRIADCVVALLRARPHHDRQNQ